MGERAQESPGHPLEPNNGKRWGGGAASAGLLDLDDASPNFLIVAGGYAPDPDSNHVLVGHVLAIGSPNAPTRRRHEGAFGRSIWSDSKYL